MHDMHDTELLKHLSQEIKTHSELIMSFRTRVAYTIWIGPFVLLGGYLLAIHNKPSLNWDKPGIIIGALVCYSLLSIVLAAVEAHTWEQCNRWRNLIARIHCGLKEPLREQDLEFKHMLFRSYAAAGILLLLIFFALVKVVFG